MILPTETQDWFTLQSRGTTQNGKRYYYGEFMHALEIQLHRKLQRERTSCLNEQYFLHNIAYNIDRQKYDRLTELFNRNADGNTVGSDNQYFPLLTLHATQNTSKVQSILKSGYLIPGMQHPLFGWHLYMNCGNAYGDGVYSSPDFDITKWYSFVDNHESIQLIINLIFVGNYKTVIPEEYHKPEEDTPHSVPSHYEDHYRDRLGHYDTLISKDLQIVVSGNVSNIVPIATVTLSINAAHTKPGSTLYSFCNPQKTLKLTNGQYHHYLNTIERSLEPTTLQEYDMNTIVPVVEMINLAGEYHIADFSHCCHQQKQQSPQQQRKLRHWICLPSKLVIDGSNTVVRNVINEFLLSLCITEKKSVFLYDDMIHRKHFSTSTVGNVFLSFFGMMKPLMKSNDERIVPCLMTMFDNILKVAAEEEEEATATTTVHIVYVFVHSPNDIETLKTIYQYKIVYPLIIKLIFCGHGYYRDLCHFKATFHNVHFFETFVHTITNNNSNHHSKRIASQDDMMSTMASQLADILDVLLEEQQNIPHTGSVLYQIPYPLGIVGQGFITAFEYAPCWDITSTSCCVLFQGSVPTLKRRTTGTTTHSSSGQQYYPTMFIDRIDHHHTTTRTTASSSSSSYHWKLYTEYQDCLALIDELEKKIHSYHDPTHNNILIWQSELTFQKDIRLIRLLERMSDYDGIEKFAQVIIPLIARFRNFIFVYPERYVAYEQKMLSLCEVFMKILNDYPVMMNKEQQEQQQKIKDNNGDIRWFFEERYPSISLRKTIRYQLQKLLSDLLTFAKLKQFQSSTKGKRVVDNNGTQSNTMNTRDWLTKLLQMKFYKKIVKRVISSSSSDDNNGKGKEFEEFSLPKVQTTCANSIMNGINLLYHVKFHDIIDAFAYMNNRLGIVIRTRFQASSEIEPWNIIVEYVGASLKAKLDMRTMFVANEYGLLIRDESTQIIVNNILLDYNANTVDDIITKMYYAYVFTRIPFCYLPAQPIALLVNTWISSLEKLFKIVFMKRFQAVKKSLQSSHTTSETTDNTTEDKSIKDEKDELMEMLQVSIHLYKRVQSMVRKSWSFGGLKEQILLSTMTTRPVEQYLTPKNCVGLPRVLACLTDDHSSVLQTEQYYHSPEYHRFCFSLLAEVSIRSAIAKVKLSKKNTSDDLIFEMLQISPQTDFATWQFNGKYSKSLMLNAVRITNKFFLKQFTNCSLFSVVSVLGFVQRMQLNISHEQILDDFINQRVSTQQFLSDHMSGYKSRETQIALYLYGMKYASYTRPDNVRFDNPTEIKRQIVDEYVTKMQSRQQTMQKCFTIREKRLAERMILAEPYKTHHYTPVKVFCEGEIFEMNQSRSVNDQLVLTASGLLQNHCCYPDCPQFLQQLTLKGIDDDEISTKRRIALRKHLRFDELIANLLPKFHENAKCLVKWSNSYDEFVEKMNVCYQTNNKYRNLFNKEAHLQSVWEIYGKGK